ncbi:MAG TPA: anti-sigma factor [Pseudolabrys sp.]|nr:anti-sigma factor [Pseudolabrys sp.]
MNEPNSPVREDELHAFVDGELPADRREAVTAWLAENPEQAALVAAWQAQAESIRARYGAVADEPVPARFDLDALMRDGGGTRGRWRTVAAAAVIAAFMVGGGAGWMARGATAAAPSSSGSITADALEAHQLYVVEVRHPVEVPGNERDHMTAWLSKRLGYAQHIPDLQKLGLKLVGGRLLPGPTGAAAMYMYEGASGERFTLYCAKTTTPESALHFREGAGDRFAAVTWVSDKAAYVVSGPSERDRLEQVSKAIYDQIDSDGWKKS